MKMLAMTASRWSGVSHSELSFWWSHCLEAVVWVFPEEERGGGVGVRCVQEKGVALHFMLKLQSEHRVEKSCSASPPRNVSDAGSGSWVQLVELQESMVRLAMLILNLARGMT